MIVVDPAAIPVTVPLLLTVATLVLDDIHGEVLVAAVADPVNIVVEPTHTLMVPVIVGNEFIVTVAVVWQPLELV